MLDDYANQSLSWKHVSSVNNHNEPTYTTTTIKGRKETSSKLVRNNRGQDVISSARAFTETLVSLNDLIDDAQIISIESAVDLNGVVQFYTVNLL